MTNPEKLSKSGKEFKIISNTLIDDVTITLEMIKNNDKQFWRRTLVRSLFACIEGINHRMKFIDLELAGINSVKLSPADHALLIEESYELDDKGYAIPKKNKIRIAENLLFTLRITASLCKASFLIDKSKDYWWCFKESLKIRNRITHPKSLEDLVISDTELKVIVKTAKWYFTLVRDVVTILLSYVEDLLKKDQYRKSLNTTKAKKRCAP